MGYQIMQVLKFLTLFLRFAAGAAKEFQTRQSEEHGIFRNDKKKI